MGNHAITGIFRAWGGRSSSASILVPHAGERAVLSVLIPLSLLAVCWSTFSREWGAWLAIPAALLATLFLCHIIPLSWRIHKPLLQWWAVLLGMLGWSFVFRDSPLAWLWFAIAILEISAWAALGFRRLWDASHLFRFFLLVLLAAAAVWIGIEHGWLAGFLAGNLLASVWCFGTLVPRSRLFGEMACRTADGGILITIDDGPDDDTPEILDILDRHATKAVFFLIGEKARKHPDLTREIARRGHEVANHTMTHPQATFWAAGPWRTAREIRRCQRVLEEITGSAPRWFRAPVGHRTLFTHPIARALGLRVMAWTCRGYDGVESDPEKVMAALLPDLQPGAIVLLHQGRPASPEILSRVLEARAARLRS